jgi:phytoene/squalene synthetase
MTLSPVQQLDTYGPDRCDTLTVEQARHWCRRLARSRYENFSVLSGLMPGAVRDDYAALYGFCRWADDLGDEVGDPERSLLPIAPFDNLIKAFEQDQTVTRYDTWEQLIGYCRLSADPVGRLVLMIGGEPRRDDLFELSDCICTALQLTNHWQDVRRDILERDRIYIPREMNDIDQFEQRLLNTARQGFAPDREFFGQSRLLVGACVDRTWPLFEKGADLLKHLSSQTRPVVWLFLAGGMQVLRAIEAWNCETVLYRPRLSMAAKLALVGRAWLGTKLRREATP